MDRDTQVELEITEHTAFAPGHVFGEVGAYEVVRGRARLGVLPETVPAGAIADLELAPRDGSGRVWLTTDLEILKPVDMARGNRAMLLDYGNRGNKRALQYFNDAPHSNRPRELADAGNGYLMRRGYAVVWIGWQGDLLPGDDRVLLDLPVAVADGRPISGRVRTEFIPERPGTRVVPLSGRVNTRSHPTTSLDTTRARLTRRRYPDSEPITIPADAWAFAREELGFGLDDQGGIGAIIPSDVHVRLPAGFEPGWIYELDYEGRDPLVLGLGHVAVRDLVAFLRRRAADDRGTANPLAGALDRAYAWGRSQTGRCIRDFVYHGFNVDPEGRRVFDGVMPHVAGAGRMNMDRFANLTCSGSLHYEDSGSDADRFPFAYAETTDPASGRRDAITKRPDSDPLVLHTQSATEYWQRRGSLVHTDANGDDLPDIENVRIYLWASTQHLSDPRLAAPKRSVGVNHDNIVQTSFLFRALLDALDRWCRDGTPPPASRIPRRADGTLVSVAAWREGFPAIPGVHLPTLCNELGSGFTVLVPATDADGNDIAGIRAPMVAVPLGTHTGWNIRGRGRGHGALAGLSGSYIPLPETEEVARMTGDPRAPITRRHTDADAYAVAIEEAARALIADGLMLEEDLDDTLRLARNWGRPRHAVLGHEVLE